MSETDKVKRDPLLLADAMLGKLARWLRLLGFDTLYDPNWDDVTIVRMARADQRLVLTRDRLLSQRSGFSSLLIESDQFEVQVRQVLGFLQAPAVSPGTRCSACNGLLEDVGADQVRDRVPPYVLQNHEAFRHCPTCDRIYWQGSHWQRIGLQIDRLLQAPGSADSPDVLNGRGIDKDPHRSEPLD